MSQVAPAPISPQQRDDENFNPNATATNLEVRSQILSPEPPSESMFPPVRGAEPPLAKIEDQFTGGPIIPQHDLLNRRSSKDDSHIQEMNSSLDKQPLKGRSISTLQDEGGEDASTNKIAPFPGYRDADVVDAEENEDSWSEVTYDSEEQRHNRNTFFTFLCLIFSCVVIIALIIIVYNLSTRNMKATNVQEVNERFVNKELTAGSPIADLSLPVGGRLQTNKVLQITLDIQNLDQDFVVYLKDTNGAYDIQVKFEKSTKKIYFTQKDSASPVKTLENVDFSMFKKGENVISFEITREGYIVKVNGNSVGNYDEYHIKSSAGGFDKIDKLNVINLTGKLKSLKIARVQT